MIELINKYEINHVLSFAWFFYLVLISFWIILQKRAPVATVSWILALATIPYFGFIIFYFFGPQKIERKTPNKKSMNNALEGHLNFNKQLEKFKADNLIAHQIAKSTKYTPAFVTDYTLLASGAETFDSMFEAIKNAKKYIHIEYYIFEPDQTGTALRNLLIEKVKEGVKVYLLLDALGAKRISWRYMRAFTDAGGKLDFFHNTNFRRFRPRLNFRTHRKIVVCDGMIGFTGGVNITDEEDIRKHPKAYSDLHLRIEGEAVHWLDHIFLEDWYYTTGETIEGIDYEQVKDKGDHKIQIIPSGPNRREAPLLLAMLSAIYEAKERIWLMTPYFVPDQASFYALRSAALKGVDVKIMVPKRSDSLFATLAARSWFEELILSGVKIYEYGPRMLHSKALLVDNKYSFVGTANFDNRSFFVNFELSVLSYDQRAATHLAKIFEDELKFCRFVPYRKKLNFWKERVPEAFARLASPLL